MVQRRQQSPLIHDLLVIHGFGRNMVRRQFSQRHMAPHSLVREVIDSIKTGDGPQKASVFRGYADLSLAERV